MDTNIEYQAKDIIRQFAVGKKQIAFNYVLIIIGKKCTIQKYCIALYKSVKQLFKTEIVWQWQGLGEKTIVQSINWYHFSVGQSATY